jgi:hypothetical protein
MRSSMRLKWPACLTDWSHGNSDRFSIGHRELPIRDSLGVLRRRCPDAPLRSPFGSTEIFQHKVAPLRSSYDTTTDRKSQPERSGREQGQCLATIDLQSSIIVTRRNTPRSAGAPLRSILHCNRELPIRASLGVLGRRCPDAPLSVRLKSSGTKSLRCARATTHGDGAGYHADTRYFFARTCRVVRFCSLTGQVTMFCDHVWPKAMWRFGDAS